MIGRRLGSYTIVEEIGRGGSSRVYRATDTTSSRDVAIKVIPNDAEDRVGFVRRFEREVQAVAQLNHPNIVSVYDRGETDDLVFLIMECVLGGTLKQRMGRPLPTPEAANAIVQMARALHHAHQRGIVHRDVKPSNMLVDMSDTHHLLLTDFGIAKLQGARGLTKSGTTIGTPEYMAPEQAEGKEIDPRADVYALGCVLYETLSGRPPFVGSTPVSVLYQQVHSRPAYIRGFNPDVPRELARVVERALAKRPEERFGTADILAEALLPFTDGLLESPAYLTGMPPSAPRTPLFPTADKPALPAAPVESTSGDLWMLGQLPHAAFPPLPHTTTGGLGQEGLDALFPGDDTSSLAPPAGGPLGSQPDAIPPIERAPTSTGRLSAPIPLPNFRLPAKTRPLSQPLTNDGLLDMDRLIRIEQENVRSREADLTGDAGGWPQAPGGRDQFGQPGQYTPGGQSERPARMRHDSLNDEYGEPATALRRALLSSGKGAPGSQAVWRPDSGELTNTASINRLRKPSMRRRRRTTWVGMAVAALLVLVVAGWVAFTSSGLAFTQQVKVAPTATHTVAPTSVPTDTPLPAPTATATTSPQQIANREAANSFRAVILSYGGDLACSAGNARTSFRSGQSIYVDLCTSGNMVSAPVSINIRRGGAVVYTMLSGQYMTPQHGYFYYTYGLSSGTYDVVVTMTIKGVTAIARDLPFTVG
ncbi:MAG TPA: serine/threonine-protein kinase [Ktedonobacterales bacterium]|nr:serine/threonine-protein kinase [Ktedonobacterales bacterium]